MSQTSQTSAELGALRLMRVEEGVALIPERRELSRLSAQADPPDQAAELRAKGHHLSHLSVVNVGEQPGRAQALEPKALLPAVHLVGLAQQAPGPCVLRSASLVVRHVCQPFPCAAGSTGARRLPSASTPQIRTSGSMS
jgi:hypothetical protein